MCVCGRVLFVWGGTLPMEGIRRPSRLSLGGCIREGRVALGGAVLTVGANPVEVEARLVAGGLGCPACDGSLGPWGWARERLLRGVRGPLMVRPRRARCLACGMSHVRGLTPDLGHGLCGRRQCS